MDAVVAIVCVAGCAMADVVLAFSWALSAWSGMRRALRREPVEIVPPEKTKYGNNRLPDFARESIVAELQRHMQAERPWLKIDLTLGDLAAGINVSPHHLSQIINSEFGKTFACYINEYRVGEACQLLSGDSGKPVLDVALDSGFSSKSSFNASFKKHTGMTPSEYRRSSRDKNYLVA
jgi:AraC-like DNA-binding protein